VARPAPVPKPAPAPAARRDPFGLGVAPPAPAPEEDFGDIDIEEPAPPAPAALAPPPPPEPFSFQTELPRAAKAPPAPIELSEGPAEEPELAPMHAFVPPPEKTGHQPEPAAAAPAVDGGEAMLRDALSKASREVIERVVWEVVPQLAETIIRENLERLVKQRQG
jgi:hypothetical protein